MIDWNEIRQMLLKIYKDKPDDFVLSIGDWCDTVEPRIFFNGRLRVTMKQLRDNNFSEE